LVEIIAEVAQGFEGKPKQAEQLAEAAIVADVDVIKFQLVYADELATPDYHYYKLFKTLEMPTEVWEGIVKKIQGVKKKVYFDIFGPKSLEIAKSLNADGIKLSTTEFYNYNLIHRVLGSNFRTILISVGGIPLNDIKELIRRESIRPGKNIHFIYGFQAEPTPLGSNNLLKISALKKEFPGFKIGFMDHSLGTSEDAVYLPLMALGTDPSCLEKHITLDPELKIEDYISALGPDSFKEFVRLIRKFEAALGTSSLDLTDLEKEYRKKAAKVVVALKDISQGTILTTECVGLKRVGEKFNTDTINILGDVLGKKAKSDVKKDRPVVREAI